MVDVHEIWACSEFERKPVGTKPLYRFTDERTAKIHLRGYERHEVILITKYGIVNPEKEMADGFASVYILEKAHVSVKVDTTKSDSLSMWMAENIPEGTPFVGDVEDLIRKAVEAAKKGEI